MTFPELFKADVRIERDIRYMAGNDERHVLDVYAPRDAQGAPVALYFYGGGWRSGDKDLFEHLGRAFAVRGIVAVVVNYRLTPDVKSPAHANDCAAATAWTYRNIEQYGGNPNNIFLTGHSAGAHLAALITLDRQYLDPVNVPEEAIRGVIMMSGVADLREHVEAAVFTRREYVEEAFGSTTEELAAASPITHLRAGLPPFLVIVAEDDPPSHREQGRNFADALRDAGNEAMFISVKGRDHFSIVRRFGPSEDATAGAMADFIKHHAL